MPSSVIRAFEYDAASGTLTITFTTGRRYAYSGVPAAVAAGLRAAASKGEYFNGAIRDVYPYARLR